MNRILVIEDDESVRCGIIELLTEEGYTVYDACNGRFGVDLARQQIPDLIISDIMMPELDGFGVLKELQRDSVTAAIPFIFLSAKTEPLDIRSGMREGADDYLTKPYKATDLLDSVTARIVKSKKYDDNISELYNNITRSIPHELRTPLISILGYSQIIKDDMETLTKDEISEMIERINVSGKSLLRIIQKFLMYNEISASLADKEILCKVKTAVTNDINICIETIIQKKAEEEDRSKDLTFEVEKASLRIHEENFEVILKELLDNAFRFSEPGSPVKVTGKVVDKDYLLEIEDKGIGLNSDQISSIGVFRQFEKELHFQPGVGLGLPISIRLMQLYSGSLTYESVKNEYTIAKILLPLN